MAGQQMRLNKGKLLLAFVLFAASIFMVTTLVRSVLRIRESKRELAELKAEQAALEKQKSTLSEEVEQLGDDDYVVRYARDHYIFSADDETVVILPSDDDDED